MAVERGDVTGGLVLLDQSFMSGSVTTSSAEEAAEEVAEVQAEVLSVLPLGMVTDVRTYKYFPVMYAALSEQALAALTDHPAVVEVFENRLLRPGVAESLSLIQQPSVVASGQLGSGTSVAVLDTGTDYTRPVFGSCSAPGTPGCRVVVARDFAPEDNALDAHGHGTNVAGIVASVAPGTSIIGLDVFTGGGAYSNVILDALEWVIDNRATHNIVAVNMSLGAGLYTSACAADVFAAGVQAVRDAGIVPVIASGNDGSTNAIASPACVPAALSVGAVYDGNVGSPGYPSAGCSDSSTFADKVTCFSNSSAQLSMLAPGASIIAAGLQMSGTSQAAPHVAGAAAVLAAAYPNATPAELFTRLTTTGPQIVDQRNGITRRRLDLAAALALDTGTPTPTEPTPTNPTPAMDVTGPTGTVTIAEGAEFTRSSVISVQVAAEDESGVAAMCVSNSRTCATWIAFQSSFDWRLARGNGVRGVYVRLRDGLGNQSLLLDTISVDTGLPVDGPLTVEPGDASVTLTMTGARDALSTELSYVVVGGPGTVAPVNCLNGPELYSGPDASATITGLENGVTVALRMCAVDAVGNRSRGVATLARPAPEFDPPTADVRLADGAAYTTTRFITLTIDAEDASGVESMCVSANRVCRNFVPYASSLPFTLRRANGVGAAFVYLRDVWGNQTAEPIVDTIIADVAPPRDGRVTVTPGDGLLQLTMTDARDALSAGLQYVVVAEPGSRAPANCASGTELYRGANATADIAGLENGVTLALRMCAIDDAGNVSRGAVALAQPAPEFDPPTGTVTINNDDVYTQSRQVTLTIDAQDASAVESMCISYSPRCSRFVPYASSVPITLGRANGTVTVFVYLRDEWGNQMLSAITDSIVADSAPPRDGPVSAVPGDASVQLTMTGARDAIASTLNYVVVGLPGNRAPPNCASGTELYNGSDAVANITGLANGVTMALRMCAQDEVGNVSRGVALLTRPAPEFDPPTGTVSIAAGAEYTPTPFVSVTIDAQDASTVSTMCVSTSRSCRAFVPFQSTLSLRLNRANGIAGVFIYLRDEWGNQTPVALSDSIIADSQAPLISSLAATLGGAGQLDLTWAARDVLSGLASYVLQYAPNLAPASCTAGTRLYAGTATNFTQTGLPSGRHGYRICATDELGHTSSRAYYAVVP